MSDIAVLDSVTEFLSSPKNLFIGGSWCAPESGKYFAVGNPATEQVIAEVSDGNAQDVDKAVTAAQAALAGEWAGVSANERSQLLLKIADTLETHAQELAQIICLENGKPHVNALGEVDITCRILRYFAGWPDKIEGATLPVSSRNGDKIFNYTVHEPVGVCGLIVPWNFPLSMCAWKLGPALASGCACILKPAEQTPLIAIRLVELIEQCGLPAGVVNLLTGEGPGVGAPLAQHHGVDKVAFTGSTAVGRLIAQAATGNMKKVSLELGGKSPNIIFPDADIKKAAKAAAEGIFYNQGQVCTAASRLYVHESVLEETLAELKKHAESHHVGPGLDKNTTLGPLVSEQQWTVVNSYIEKARAEGAQLICGGDSPDRQGWYVNPTVFLDANEKTCIAREEIFGPVLTVMSWSSEDDLIERANGSLYGLAAGLWTNNLQKAHKTAEKLKAGTVWINCWNLVNPAAPFGGYKQSGWGREMGREVISAYTETKSVFVNLTE